MPRIGLNLPGKRQKPIEQIADGYTITVERNDGIACTPLEAQTTMSMYFMEYCLDMMTQEKNYPETRKPVETNCSPPASDSWIPGGDWTPNAVTVQAMQDCADGKDMRSFGSIDELMADLHAED